MSNEIFFQSWAKKEAVFSIYWLHLKRHCERFQKSQVGWRDFHTRDFLTKIKRAIEEALS